jgi:hypothetical protein
VSFKRAKQTQSTNRRHTLAYATSVSRGRRHA